ncbi:HK97 gp10 family phage protein [Paenibacillus gansuensis]|uniref:HK97 gp10 family phage protein n=1 Tax=Paenibacillus gansuensis TaxID=306542 RepID=A0ABW5PJ02_9BACL
MAEFDIDYSNVEVFKNELDSLQELFPREARQVMLRSGSKARGIVARKARQLVKKVTGTYLRSIKRGKVWMDEGEESFKVRIYTGAPHGHLIEYGHRIVDKSGKELGFKEGYHVFDRAAAEVSEQWNEILEREFDRIMDKL